VSEQRRYLAELGERIIRNGYSIVPIKPGTKFPPGDEWQKVRADRAQWEKWVAGGHAYSGVGILTYNAPLADLDIKDAAFALEMEAWIYNNISEDIVKRIGEYPKRGIPFRCDAPFSKITSSIFLDPSIPPDPDGSTRKSQTRVEILCNGQQYVSRHIHPDTNRPYEYPDGGAPEDLHRDDLPLLTETQAHQIVEHFNNRAAARGWKVYRKGREAAPQPTNVSRIHQQIAQQPIDDLTEEQIEEYLMAVPPREDYHGWLEIGQALHHQYSGGQRGLDLWHQHSLLGMGYDATEIERKWISFGKDEKRHNVTFRTIKAAAEQAIKKRAEEATIGIKAKLAAATTQDDIRSICKEIKKAELDSLNLSATVADLRAAIKRINGAPISDRDARKLVRREDATALQRPDWLDYWYWVSGENQFYHYLSKNKMNREAFNATFDRKLLSKLDRLEGKAIPDVHASDLALNLHEIPTVAGVMFLPGEDETFTFEGKTWVNGFSPGSVPAMPDQLSARDRLMVQRFQEHLEHLIADEHDRATFLAWFAYPARTFKRCSWSVLLQSTEGDGKTFLFELMGAMIGSGNVKTVNVTTIETTFQDWAHGSVFSFVDEVKMHGHNKYDVINKLKPYITNRAVEIHPKGGKPYTAINTATYLMASNYQDAIPLGKGDSRYFPIMSRWQDQEVLLAWKAENPDYYSRLQEVLDHGPAIRKWLLEEYEPPAWFNPNARAPQSKSRAYMIEVSKSDTHVAIEDALADNADKSFLSTTLLSTVDLEAALLTLNRVPPRTSELNRVLQEMGFQYLDRVFVDGRPRRYWSKTPGRFKYAGGKIDKNAIREWHMSGSI
jgi:hypothetical protein